MRSLPDLMSYFDIVTGRNECESAPCHNGGTCHRGHGDNGYVCVCTEHYDGLHCDTPRSPNTLGQYHVIRVSPASWQNLKISLVIAGEKICAMR